MNKEVRPKMRTNGNTGAQTIAINFVYAWRVAAKKQLKRVFFVCFISILTSPDSMRCKMKTPVVSAHRVRVTI